MQSQRIRIFVADSLVSRLQHFLPLEDLVHLGFAVTERLAVLPNVFINIIQVPLYLLDFILIFLSS